MCGRLEKQFKYTEPVETDRPVTTLLRAWRGGDEGAGRELIVLLQPELHRIAAQQMRRERPGHTLQPTALVNALYVEMMEGVKVEWQDRAHFLAVASNLLRRLLVEYARKRNAAKRGGGQIAAELDENAVAASPGADAEVLDIHSALEELEALDPRPAKVIELRYFGGLTETETAEVMKISLTTMKRDFAFARAWLADRLSSGQRASEP